MTNSLYTIRTNIGWNIEYYYFPHRLGWSNRSLYYIHYNMHFCPRPRKAERGIWKCRPSEICCKCLKFVFVDQLISNLHTSIILGISSSSSKLGKIRKKKLRSLPKHIKISKCYNFNENWYLEDFWPEECDSDKCDLKMAAITAIMVAILAAIFNMVAKTHKQFRNAPITKKIYI